MKSSIMQHEALVYSLDPKITISQFQAQEHIVYDASKYSKLQRRVTEHTIGAMMISDVDFHYKLLSIRPKVQLLYYLGNISLLNHKILGIVGPRKMSIYGKKVVETLFTPAADYDLVTISGLAEGVDQLCHQLSREHKIPTIAVLGGGLGRYLRRQECSLIEQIVADGGLVISEYKLFEQPTHYTFPQRNRLIAGLADVLFLPEAGQKSGSLITVDCAIAMKKPVYATPNTIFAPTSAGILQLIETGYVKPIVDLQKFLATHFISKHISSRSQTTVVLTDQEQGLLSALSRDQGRELQNLVQTTGVNIQEIIPLLTMLEIKGLVAQDVPGRYILM
ncbi:MAG: DNA-protecting protein DprA [Candidatus Absconditabacterales bacterium]